MYTYLTGCLSVSFNTFRTGIMETINKMVDTMDAASVLTVIVF